MNTLINKDKYYELLKNISGNSQNFSYKRIYEVDLNLGSENINSYLRRCTDHLYMCNFKDDGSDPVVFVYFKFLRVILFPIYYGKSEEERILKDIFSVDNWELTYLGNSIRNSPKYFLNTYKMMSYHNHEYMGEIYYKEGKYILINKFFPEDKPIEFSLKNDKCEWSIRKDNFIAFPGKNEMYYSLKGREEIKQITTLIGLVLYGNGNSFKRVDIKSK